MGCRRALAPERLMRVRLRSDGGLATGPGPGRGAWICPDTSACWDLAERRGAFARALRVPLTPGAVAKLRAELSGRASMEASPLRGGRVGRGLIRPPDRVSTHLEQERNRQPVGEEDPGL